MAKQFIRNRRPEIQDPDDPNSDAAQTDTIKKIHSLPISQITSKKIH